MPTYQMHNPITGEIHESDNREQLCELRTIARRDSCYVGGNDLYILQTDQYPFVNIPPMEWNHANYYQQLDLFGSALTVMPTSGWVHELGAGRCDSCSSYLETTTRTVSEYEAMRLRRSGVRVHTYIAQHTHYVSNYPVREDHSVSETYCPTCEIVCEYCNAITGPDRDCSGMCENCESCSECCECIYCEDCDRMVSDDYISSCGSESGSYHCERCCECDRCSYCNEWIPSGSYPCEHENYCERCCENHCDLSCDCGYSDCPSCCEDSEETDLSTVATFDPSGLFSVGRSFGVELEMSDITPSRAAASVRTTGLQCRNAGYSHSVSSTEWKAVTDGSSGVSAEVVSPILTGEHGLEQLRVTMLALRSNGARVGNGTGTHVHFDMTGASGKELAAVARFYAQSQLAIDSIHSPSRRNEYYCRPSYMTEIESVERCDTHSETVDSCSRLDRYRSCNLNAFAKYQTIEFRQHRGTLNYRKLAAWIGFCQSLITAALAGAKGCDSIGVLLLTLRRYGLSEQHASYLLQRSEELAA